MTETAKIGRPSLLDKAITDKLASILRIGVYRETACVLVNISKQTFYNWIDRAEQDREAGRSTEFTNFLDAIEKAEAEAEFGALATVRGGKNNWTANAWFLERKMPRKYGRREEVEHSTKDGQAFAVFVPAKAERAEDWAKQSRAPKK